MSTEERILRLEIAFNTLVELARTQSERMDESDSRFEKLVDEYDRRFEKLVDEYDRRFEKLTDDYDRRFAELTDQYDRRFAEVAEAQKQAGAHISVLAEVMADLGRAQARTETALTRTEGALTSLTERFEQYISSRP